jgi:hypothetical protein
VILWRELLPHTTVLTAAGQHQLDDNHDPFDEPRASSAGETSPACDTPPFCCRLLHGSTGDRHCILDVGRDGVGELRRLAADGRTSPERAWGYCRDYRYRPRPACSQNGVEWLYVLCNVAIFVLSFLNALVHSRDAWTSVVPTGLTLSVIVFVLMLANIGLGSAVRLPPVGGRI